MSDKCESDSSNTSSKNGTERKSMDEHILQITIERLRNDIDKAKRGLKNTRRVIGWSLTVAALIAIAMMTPSVVQLDMYRYLGIPALLLMGYLPGQAFALGHAANVESDLIESKKEHLVDLIESQNPDTTPSPKDSSEQHPTVT